MLITVIITAILLDSYFGEPKKFHPLVGFGNLVNILEKHLNKGTGQQAFINGGLALSTLIFPPLVLTVLIKDSLIESYLLYWAFDSVILYWAIGNRSLAEHVSEVHTALSNNDLEAARLKLSYIVSRDTESLSSTQITQATIETDLENGSDSVFAPLFWYCVLGSPAVIAHRLCNTLDAMWGYRSERFEAFGKFSAKLDDVLNYIPARLVATSYALLGNAQRGFSCWKEQATLLSSPNAGSVMCAGAGSLNVQLGGPSHYQDQLLQKPFFGGDKTVELADIQRSLELVKGCLISWCLIIACVTVL